MANLKITMANYGDYELFGPRIETNKLIASLKAGNDSECILFPVGTFASKDRFRLRDIVGTDRRVRQMVEGLGIEHALPIQRYSWQKIHKSTFPNLFISAESTGKTYAHLLYAVTKCLISAPLSEVEEMLNGESNRHVTSEHYTELEDLINHPKYIVICSSQDKVESIFRTVDYMKQKAYGDFVPDQKRHVLTPVTRTVKLDHDNDKLAQRCIESDILIGNPQALIKCLEQGLITFNKCKKVLFDDLDVALQVQNTYIRDLIKIYLVQMQVESESGQSVSSCRVHMFSSKWTDLVKQFLSSVFPQRTVLFSSISEAAVYANVRFEVEIYEKQERKKIDALINLLGQPGDTSSGNQEKIAIVCKTDEEAKLVGAKLTGKGFKVAVIIEADEDNAKQFVATSNIREPSETVFVISDAGLEFEVEFSTRKRPLNDIVHLIHASIPDDMLTFDQRFRLMYKNIQDAKNGLTSTLIVSATASFKLARQIYDLASRSAVTMKSTKCTLRNLIADQANQICWRWATTGLCRLEKLSRNDRFGSYCLDRHSVDRSQMARACNSSGENWPESGMVSITLTHIVSPSEFYFLFEAKADEDNNWIRFDSTGRRFMKSLQRRLNGFKDVRKRSLPLNQIKKGGIYAVYFPQDCRVDRVLILDEPKHENQNSMINEELEYNKMISTFKMDHGVCLDVYVKNLVQLPEDLVKIPSQCHRGFHLGYKPPDNEPNWLYKSKKYFYDKLIGGNQQVTAWVRLNREGCFWFENMLVTRKLTNIDRSDEKYTFDPYAELCRCGLADSVNTEPPILLPSMRMETMGRWNHADLIEAGRYAFLRKDVMDQEIFILQINSDLDVIVRQSTYNAQLIDLEADLLNEHKDGKMLPQKYLVNGTLCVARINSTEWNRVKIVSVPEVDDNSDIEAPTLNNSDCKFLVECLDHGDKFHVFKEDLFQASVKYLTRLPFQAIKCEFANFNKNLYLNSPEKRRQLVDGIYDLSRDDANQMKRLRCKMDSHGKIYVYVPIENSLKFEPLYKLLKDLYHLEIHDKLDDVCQETLYATDYAICDSTQKSILVNHTIIQLLREIAEESLIKLTKPEH